MLGKIEGRRRRGQKKMRWLDGITDSVDMFGQALGDREGQGSLACCSPWGHKELDTTEQLNHKTSSTAPSPFTPTSAPPDLQKTSCEAHSRSHGAPPTEVRHAAPAPPPLRSGLSERLRRCLPGHTPHFAPNKTELTTLTSCIFLVNNIKEKNGVGA